ncbi:MAG: efflux RND transporter periplasmic adaptor subunit [Pirellulaceae bacterium]
MKRFPKLSGALMMGGLLIGLGQAAPGQAPKAGAPPPSPKVIVATARRDKVSEPKTFVGTVKPLRKSIVGSAAPGRVEEYLVNDGDFVKKGDPIAHLRRGVIGAEKKSAEAELSLRKAELAELADSWEDQVKQAKAKLASAKAMLEFRESKRERGKTLGTSAAREETEENIALASQSHALVEEAVTTLRKLTQGPNQQMEPGQKNEADMTAAATWTYALGQAKVAVQAAEVERLTEQYDRHTMFAPFDGFVTAELTEVGQWVMQGDPIAEIAELSMVDVEIGVLEDYVARLDVAVVGDVEVPSLRGRRFEGQIAVINPQADARSRTFPVKVRVQNEQQGKVPLLKAGMFARVTLAVGDPVAVPLIPKDAVVLSGKTPLVYVVDTDPKTKKSVVRPVPITLGASRGLWVSVGNGEIKDGDQVVVEGNERLRPMQEVRTERREIPYEKEQLVGQNP